jgi:hypothetical protein
MQPTETSEFSAAIRAEPEQVEVSISDVTVIEGGQETIDAVFVVNLSGPSNQTVLVGFDTANDTAENDDYQPTSGILTFAPGGISFRPGETRKTITIKVNGDTVDEPNETFFINLSAATNAAIADGQGIGTIVDDDPVPGISISDTGVAETGGRFDAVFLVTLSALSELPISVVFETEDDTAVADDYQPTAGTLSFAPLQAAQFITVDIKDDALDEDFEGFFVNLHSATNATIADSQGRGVISDNDPRPIVTVDDITVAEGDVGTGDAVFAVMLSNPSGQTVRVGVRTFGTGRKITSLVLSA